MEWSAGAAIRERREALGLSQANVAEAIGVSKSLLSHIESGKRHPTDEQIGILSDILSIPQDLLTVGTGRFPADVADAVQENAADVVAAIRQRMEAAAVAFPQAPTVVPIASNRKPPQSGSTLPDRINVRKNSASYRAHSYHTKVPPDAIRPFIKAFTNPGETVFDPFCGSGMTGVAALLEGRNALLSDMSTAAVHIARNYTTPCNPDDLENALRSVERTVAPTIEWLYGPIGSEQTVEYTTWSDVFRCPSCNAEILYWDLVQSSGAPSRTPACPTCNSKFRKDELEWIGERAVQSHVSAGSTRIQSHPPTRQELDLIENARKSPIPYWTPNVDFGPQREMWRASHRAMGINSVNGFFTRRNLHALAALRHAIIECSEGRTREALMFAFTAMVNRASRRYQWNAKRPTNVMTGTLYISSLRYEWNVWSLFRRKAADVLRYYRSFPSQVASADVFQRSATDLDCLPDGSVDMVFMDPPFGSNIYYADSSLLWEAWLGGLSDPASEIVINKSHGRTNGGKTLEDYGDLMRQSFAQAARALKKTGYAVLAFSNSDDSVWETVRRSLSDAGLDTESVHLLSKGQPSIKGVKGVSGKENVTTFDLLLCLKRRKAAAQMAVPFPPPQSFMDQAIRDATSRGNPPIPCRTDEIYSAVIRASIERGYSVSGITMPGIADRCEDLGGTISDGHWAFPQRSHPKSRDFLDGYLARPTSLPASVSGPLVGSPLREERIPGGRNSAFYSAHSYHTKVPPEAINSFLEHYTQPGDVVLDPFCGSGMTGVAAALAGRRAILNDLSPAAIHMAWNHTRPCDPEALEKGFAELEARVSKRINGHYQTEHLDGRPGLIHWTMWSTRHKCTECEGEFLLWNAMDRKSGRLGNTVECPSCHTTIQRNQIPTLGSEPAWVAYAVDGKRFEKEPDTQDVQRAIGFAREDIQSWYPTTPLSADREMYIRCALQLQGISTIADFYTPRNLDALAVIWEEIGKEEDERIRRVLAFAFTNTAWHGTRMRRFNARGGQRPLTGTLYIPQLSSEANVLEVMRNKIRQLKRYYRAYRPQDVDLPAILLGSATNLSEVPSQSIDYVFTDPPFGSNIFYADCNLIWESWLGRLTSPDEEAVVNRSLSPEKGGKTLSEYSELLARSMLEIRRVLRPGAWATIVFHNTNAEVWQAIRDAADGAGFEFHEASSLDRRQQSHKGYKGRSGSEDVAHFDVVFNLRKPKKHLKKLDADSTLNGDSKVRELVETIAANQEIAQRGIQGVHAEVMRQLASRGDAAFISYAQVREIWDELQEATQA